MVKEKETIKYLFLVQINLSFLQVYLQRRVDNLNLASELETRIL